jgi:hypothetical protein
MEDNDPDNEPEIEVSSEEATPEPVIQGAEPARRGWISSLLGRLSRGGDKAKG